MFGVVKISFCFIKQTKELESAYQLSFNCFIHPTIYAAKSFLPTLFNPLDFDLKNCKIRMIKTSFVFNSLQELFIFLISVSDSNYFLSLIYKIF